MKLREREEGKKKLVLVFSFCFFPRLIPSSTLSSVKHNIMTKCMCFPRTELEKLDMAKRSLLILEALQDKQTYHDPRLNANKQGEKTQTTDKFEESLVNKNLH